MKSTAESDQGNARKSDALLSVVLAMPGGYNSVRKTVSHLQAQTVRDALELIIVAPSEKLQNVETEQLTEFARFQAVEIPAFRSIGHANTIGILHAAAPLVALAEDHCFPDPVWAEKLIEAHQGPWAAVGPGVRNANPGSAVSWADLLIGYGPWLTPSSSRETEFLPGHNSSYKREVLLEYRDRLESLMESETVLHWDLRENGHRLYLASDASVAHTNFSLWSSWLPAQLHNGRLFAGIRAQQKGPAWRALYVMGAPLIPFVRLYRIWAGLPTTGLKFEFFRCLHAMIIGLVLDGVGQMMGYAWGAGDSQNKVARYEVERLHHISEKDRLEIFGDGPKQVN